MAWVRQLRFKQVAQETMRLDCLHEVEHMAERVKRLEQAIAEEVKAASPALREVICGLQALCGVAQISAVTIAAELGTISRFEGALQLMGYSGAAPTENSSGQRTRRGSFTKTGNAHLRRIAIEAACSNRPRPGVGMALRKRQEGVAEVIKEIAWKAQNRLHKRYCRLAAAGKDQRKIITGVEPSCWASSGLSGSRLKLPASRGRRPDEEQEQRQKQNSAISFRSQLISYSTSASS